MSTHKRVPIKASALFRLTSPRRLANILMVTPTALERLVRWGDENYLVRPLAQVEGKAPRMIEEPKPKLKLIHQRFARLLASISNDTSPAAC